MELIDKADVVAEIERRKEFWGSKRALAPAPYAEKECKEILSFIDTLEVKEVDLEKEIKDYFNNQPIITRSKGIDYQFIPSNEDIAKHFFELGYGLSHS